MSDVDKVPTPEYSDFSRWEYKIRKQLRDMRKKMLRDPVGTLRQIMSSMGISEQDLIETEEHERQQRTTSKAGAKSNAKRGKRTGSAKGTKRKRNNRVAKKRIRKGVR